MKRRHQRSSERGGVLLVDKPAGPSSHAVVDWIRWVLGEQRVGHCGTLDPAATGLLVVVVGAVTRIVPYLTDADKTYRARFVVGRSTTTADVQGETLERVACGPAECGKAVAAISSLVGTHALAPPRFSAVKVGGVAAHVRARAGDAGQALAPRTMIVRRVDEVCAIADPPAETVAIDATLAVSKGTYIRSLVEFVGRKIERPAHLGALRRLASGDLSVDDARLVGPLQATALASGSDGKPRWRLRPANPSADMSRHEQAQWLRSKMIAPQQAWPLPWIELPPGEAGDGVLMRLCEGRPVALELLMPSGTPLSGTVGVGRTCSGGAFIVARVEAGEIRPERTVWTPNSGCAA